MKNSYKKFIITLFAVLFTVEPVLQLSQITIAKAADANASAEQEPVANVVYDGNSTPSQPTSIDTAIYKIPLKTKTKTGGMDNIILSLAGIHSDEDQKSGIGLEEALSNQVEPRIILNSDDQQALKILWRMSGSWMMPDFEREPEAIWVQYPKFKTTFIKEKKDIYNNIITILGHEVTSVDDIAAIKVANGSYYLDLSHYAQLEWTKSLGDVATAIRKQTDDAIDSKKFSPDSATIETISDVTGETVEAINNIFADNALAQNTGNTALAEATKEKYTNLMSTFSENIKAIKIDIRVVNMLVYLVTPKTQGGAGHYRIKVKTILSGYTAPKKIFSNESTNTIYNSGKQAVSNTTAADYGQNRADDSQSTSVSSTPQALNDDDPDALAIVSDQDGESYNAFVSTALAASASAADAAVAGENATNISAHSDGQAVDISEIDDIRCTLIKKRRIGGYSRSKFEQRPIKLAWQTAKGYADNGGSDLYKSDMANVLKSFASDSIKDLVSEFGGDISNYEGDLSSSGFSDVAMLIGKSIFTQIINSPSSNLQGYNFGDTLTQLGGMYLADYLGLPREMFTQGHIPDSYDELAEKIGTAAIEKRLDLPIGTFGGNNLKEMLQKVGQRKLEVEMNLKTGALDNYFKTSTTTSIKENQDYLIGKAILEQELSLPAGSFTGKNNIEPADFAELKKSLGETKIKMAFSDPVYIDNLLHIGLGTTEQFINGTISPHIYAAVIGAVRRDDTVYGFQFMAAKDAAYELDAGTFTKAINGESDALTSIGIKSMARVFATGDDERTAFTIWVTANLQKDPADENACNYEDPVKVALNPGTPEFREVTISETKATTVGLNNGDLFTMFSCPTSNPRSVFQTVGSKILRDSLVQYYLTPDEKIKFNLLETNHVFHSSDEEKQFYVTRAYDILTILERIKGSWSGSNKDPEYLRMKKVVDEASDNIKAILDQSMPVTTVDGAKTAGRSLAVVINKFKSDVVTLKSGANRYVNKTNGTIIDVNKLVRDISEIMAGKEIPSTDVLTLDLIPTNTFIDSPDNTVNAPSLNSAAASRSSGSSLIGLTANKQTFMLLLSRKMKPSDFFLILASDKVETALDLPQNSLIYFVQNYEKKGLGTLESFYSAVGQAKIEETFNMPNKYFQGALFDDPALWSFDFRNDLYALYEYAQYDVEKEADKPTWHIQNTSLSTTKSKFDITNDLNTNTFATELQTPESFNFLNADGTAPDLSTLTDAQKETAKRENYVSKLINIKVNDSKTFDYLVNLAEQNLTAQRKEFYRLIGLNGNTLENDISSVVFNIGINKLNDGIRTAEQDLLFRMGISGSVDALTTGNSVAWLDASGRANQIDALLNLPAGSTKSLFTGERIVSNAGADRLSTKDKQILVAKMGVSPVAIDKLLQFLSGDIPFSALSEKIANQGSDGFTGRGLASDITNLGDNPFLGTSSDTCSAGAFTQDSTTGQMISGSMVPNGWFYFDQTIATRAGKTFGSKGQAEEYASNHKADQVSYLEELSYGLAKISYSDADYLGKVSSVKDDLTNFLNGTSKTVQLISNSDAKQAIEKKLGVTAGTLDSLFNKSYIESINAPLVDYKRAVGVKVVTKAINSKIFNALGIKIDPALFGPNEFFEIMQGNFSALWGVAGAMVDQRLSIPSGSTMKILTAKSADLRSCAVSEIGGSIIGKFVGLDYVSLSGNIYDNVGRSRIEKMLGLAHNSFSGKDIAQLINNVGVVNFYIAFQYPVSEVDLDLPLRTFYGATYADSVKAYSNNFKLKKIKEFLDINTNLSANSEYQAVYLDLKKALIDHITNSASNARIDPGSDRTQDGKWRQGDWGTDKKDEVLAYLSRVDSIDQTFGITIGTTASFIVGKEILSESTQQVACGIREDGTPVPDPDNAGRIRWDDCNDSHPANHDTLNIRNGDGSLNKTIPAPGNTCQCDMATQPAISVVYNVKTSVITPDEYIEKISSKTLLGIAAYSAMDLFDFDMTEVQKQAVVGVLTHYGNWVKEGDAGYAKIYNGLSTIFSLHLDSKAGLEEGSFRRMIENPGKIGDVLLPQAAKKLDERFGVDSSNRWSFSGTYARYFNSSPETNLVKATSEEDCGPEQAEIDANEAYLQTKEKEVSDWVNANSGVIDYAAADSPNSYGATTQAGFDITKQPGYDEMSQTLQEINAAREENKVLKNSCKAGNRFGNETEQETKTYSLGGLTGAVSKYCSKEPQKDTEMCVSIRGSIGRGEPVLWKFAWMMMTDYASDLISDKIFDATLGTLRMPADDIKHFFVNGDMRYFLSALVCYSANTYLNNNNTGGDGSLKPMPQAWQIPYEMIKLWIVGDSDAENYSANVAAAGYLTDKTVDYETTLPPTAYGDVFNQDYTGGFLGTFSSQDFDISSQNANSEPNNTSKDNLIEFSNAQANTIYNGGRSFDAAALEASIDTLNTKANTCKNRVRNTDPNMSAHEKAREQNLENDCSAAIRDQNELNITMSNAKNDTRTRFQKQAQYRMMDSALWSKDHNVFPGFSFMLLEGSSTQKNVAIALYLKNGLVNGEFFGQKSAFLQSIEEKTGMSVWDWKQVVDFGVALAGQDPAGDILYKFDKSGGLDAVTTFIQAHSENWFGFAIDKDYAKGLMVGITTGQWGLSLDGKNRVVEGTTSDGKNNYSFKTLGQVFTDNTLQKWENKAFTWADRQIGWKPGKALEAFNTAKTIVQSVDTIKKLHTLESLENAVAKAETIDAVNEATHNLSTYREANAGIADAADNAKGAHNAGLQKQADVWAIACNYAGGAVTRWIYGNNGAKIAAFEQKMSIVPGSLEGLIQGFVTSGLMLAVGSLTLNPFLVTMSIGEFVKSLLMFVGINLFGFYATELKCSADGYYPEIESPSPAADSNSGIAVWNGMNADASQRNTIAAAQYKAKRLILDVLEMHNNPIYKDVYASQIMTGRNEDVLALNDDINENMCSVIGLVSIAGICNGDTQAGVWENLQTTTYTHIGF